MRTGVILGLLLCGCLVDVADDVEFGRNFTPPSVHEDEGPDAPPPVPPTDEDEDEDEGEDGSSSGDEPFRYDLGSVPLPPADCKNIDFLFVIDNSISMKDEQGNLVRSVPGFIGGIEQMVEDVESFHVGVVTTDAYAWNVEGCNELGGLVVQTGGLDSSARTCGPYADDNNFMTEADDLDATFACAAQVGVSGSAHEQPMEALRRVTSGHMSSPRQCNAGFLRDEALLVVVLLTDEADGPGDPGNWPSPGTPQTWYDDLVAAKGGNPNNVVVISFINTQEGACEFSAGGGYDGANIATFTHMFDEQGFVFDVCAGDYGPLFTQAVAGIANTCNTTNAAG